MEIPEKFKGYLGRYGDCFFDSYSGEPISWGYPITKHLGEELWSELAGYGDLQCAHSSGNWYLIIKSLTIPEAIEKYGAVTKEERGPRGGFRTVTYGKTQFSSKQLDPKLTK